MMRVAKDFGKVRIVQAPEC